GYIRMRMETQKLHDTHGGNFEDEMSKGTRSGADLVMNWIVFGGEALLVLGLTTFAPLHRSRKTYCELCSSWMVREITPFEPAQATELTEALRTGSARTLAAVCAKPAFATVPNLTLGVEFCPSAKDGRSRDCPAFVSLKNVVQSGSNSFQDLF